MRNSSHVRRHLVWILFTALLAACATQPIASLEPHSLRLATTTSTQDSGLLDAILPNFETRCGCRVDVIAVGTGQALTLGANGDADVVLVHARSREDQFVAQADGIDRRDVMYNDFVLVGPADDPAGVTGLEMAHAALARIAATGSAFASRGDDSGTHTKEISLWASIGITPTSENAWYLSLGQGMGETLKFADERGAYSLTDRATYLALREHLPNLVIVVGGESVEDNPDEALLNHYGVIIVNPEKHPGVQFDLARQFVEWLTSVETQRLIGEYGADKYGQPLFFPVLGVGD